MKNVCNLESFLMDDGVILFTVECFDGMVGESIEVHRAVLLRNVLSKSEPVKRDELSYEQLRYIYKRFIKAKSERVRFWRLMRGMSPEAEKQRLQDEFADARARVI